MERCQVVLTGGIGILMSVELHPVSKSSFIQPWGALHRNCLWESLQEGLKGGKTKPATNETAFPHPEEASPQSAGWEREGHLWGGAQVKLAQVSG